MKARPILMALVALAVGGVGPLTGQERQREERSQQLREAEHQAQEALRMLEEALGELRESRSARAREQLEQAMRALRAAQRQLGDRLWVGAGEAFDMLPRVMVMAGRPRIGVEIRSASAGGTDSIGAEILSVTPDGPADEAGLEAGDIITKINGESLARVGNRGREPGSKLIDIVRKLDEGDSVTIEYRRDGQTRSASVVLRELPGEFDYSFRVSPEISGMRIEPRIDVVTPEFSVPRVLSRLSEFGWLDIELVTLDEELGAYFGAKEGVLVLRVPEEESLNLKTGDVILSIDGRKPKDPSHALRIIRSYEEGESVSMEIMRQKRRMTVTAVVPERQDRLLRREWRERRER